MKPLIVAPEAEEDLFEIWSYLLENGGETIASRIDSELWSAFAGLALTPGKGHRRSDLTAAKVLFFTVYQYMVIYRVGTTVEILSVIHGKRDVRAVLEAREY